MGFSTAAFGDMIFAGADAIGISAPTVSAIGTGIEEGAGALAISAASNKILGGPRPVMPPSPVISQQQQDLSAQQAEQNAMRRQSVAGGMNSTVGTSGGQAGSMLNPSNMGGKTLLGQ